MTVLHRTLGAAAAAVGGRLAGPEAGPEAGPDAAAHATAQMEFGAVSTDTRTLPPKALFVALRGPRFDANEFVAAAAAAGAVGAIVDRWLPTVSLPQIVVADTLAALQELAAAWRRQFQIPVVAVAGSNGKTTTKEMTAAILARAGATLSTQGNLNNHIGVPLTLLRLEASHRAAVVELGADREGEVAQLMRWVCPTVGLITNAGAEHLEFFGDLAGVARGEGEAVAGLAADGVAVINADDAFADYWRGVCTAGRTLSFGRSAGADFRALGAQETIENGEFRTRFTLASPLGEATVSLRVGGAHNLVNALAAAAAASAAGASLADIAAGLGDFRAVSGRLQLKAGRQGAWIIDDSYNANPDSVRAGLDVLARAPGAKWLVFGDMGELGSYTEASHAEVGVYAREHGVERLFALGLQTPRTVASFGRGAEWFADAAALLARLDAELTPGVTVLVKGSRLNRLERVVAALTARNDGAG